MSQMPLLLQCSKFDVGRIGHLPLLSSVRTMAVFGGTLSVSRLIASRRGSGRAAAMLPILLLARLVLAWFCLASSLAILILLPMPLTRLGEPSVMTFLSFLLRWSGVATRLSAA